MPPVRRPARRARLPRSARPPCRSYLVDHGLGRRAQRVARAAAITAVTTGLSTDAGRDSDPFGFCHYSPAPGYQIAARQLLHRQPQRRRQGVPADRHRRRHPLGDHADRARPAQRRPHDPIHRSRHQLFRRLRVPVRAVLTDNGPEYIAAGFRAHLAAKASSMCDPATFTPGWLIRVRRRQVLSGLEPPRIPGRFTGPTGRNHLSVELFRRSRSMSCVRTTAPGTATAASPTPDAPAAETGQFVVMVRSCAETAGLLDDGAQVVDRQCADRPPAAVVATAERVSPGRLGRVVAPTGGADQPGGGGQSNGQAHRVGPGRSQVRGAGFYGDADQRSPASRATSR